MLLLLGFMWAIWLAVFESNDQEAGVTNVGDGELVLIKDCDKGCGTTDCVYSVVSLLQNVSWEHSRLISLTVDFHLIAWCIQFEVLQNTRLGSTSFDNIFFSILPVVDVCLINFNSIELFLDLFLKSQGFEVSRSFACSGIRHLFFWRKEW